MLFVVVLVSVLAGALGVWAVVFAVADRAVVLRQLIAGGVVEAALVAQGVVLAVQQAGGQEIGDPVTMWGYLIVALLLLPGAAVVALAERTRWSSIVLAAVAVTVIFMELRMWQLWQA